MIMELFQIVSSVIHRTPWSVPSVSLAFTSRWANARLVIPTVYSVLVQLSAKHVPLDMP